MSRYLPAPTERGARSLLSRLLRGTASIAAANGVSKLLALAFMVLAARLLGPSEFGKLALVLSLGLIAATLPATGFPQALLWKLGSAKSDEERERALAAAVAGTGLLAAAVGMVMALLVLIRGLAAWLWFCDDGGCHLFTLELGLTSPTALLVGAIVLADSTTYLFLNLHLGLLHHRQVALFSAGRNLTKLLLLLPLAVLAPDIDHGGVVGVYLLAPLLTLAAVEFALPSGVRRRPSAFRRPVFKEMGLYGLPLIFSAVAMAVLMRGDVVALNHWHGTHATGSYYAAKQLLLPVLLLPVAARGLLVPALAGGELDRRGWRRLALLVLGGAGAIAVVVGVAGPELVTLLYGNEFEVAQQLTLTVAAAAWLLAARELAAARLMGAGRPGLLLVADTVAVVVALAGYWWLVPDHAADGAAGAMALGTLVGLAAALGALAVTRREAAT